MKSDEADFEKNFYEVINDLLTRNAKPRNMR